MGAVLHTRAQTLWLTVIAFLVLLSEKREHTVVTADNGVTKVSSGNVNAVQPKLDESSLRNRNEKEQALSQAVYQTQTGGVPHVTITPPFLDFSARPICIPVVQNIEVINTSEEQELTLFSITTDSAHFHPPIFKQTVLAPLGKTTIAVIFVPRSSGTLDGNLVIQTSLGGFMYQARGEGVANPYKVAPLLGARVPVGVGYTPSLQLFNPFEEPLHVKEVYTSEGFLHLNLPKTESQEASGTAGLWELQPKQLKNVINLSFKSQSAGKYQGFVHMKTDRDNLVIPIEIVAIKGGVHRSPEELHFGTLTSPTETKTLAVSLLNSGSLPLQCTDLYMLSPDSHLSLDFRKRVMLPPGQETTIAHVTYRARTEGQFSGKLLGRLNNTNLANSRIEIPYKARVLHGDLQYSESNTTFAVGRSPFEPVVKELVLMNRFPLAVVITEATIADSHFRVLEFSSVVIPSGGTQKVLSIQFLASSLDMLYQTSLRLSTNASVQSIPLRCYHGRLLFSLPEPLPGLVPQKNASGNLVDFGMLGVNEDRARLFNLTNLNPMAITLRYRPPSSQLKFSLAFESLSRLSERPGSSQPPSSWATSHTVKLPPGHSALFSLKVSSLLEENVSSTVSFSTEHESLEVQLRYQSVHGSLQFTHPVQFEGCFPGTKRTQPLIARSTCKRPLTILSIRSSDPRVAPVLTKQVLEPNKLMQVGHLVFNPAKGDPRRDYMNLLPAHWMDGEELSPPEEPLSPEDLEAWSARSALWSKLCAAGAQSLKATIVVDTDVVTGSRVAVHGELFKPSVVAAEDANVLFGLTQVGAVAERYVTVHNPSDTAVHMHLVQVRANSTLANASKPTHIRQVVPEMLFSSDFRLSRAAIHGQLVPAHSTGKLGPVFFEPSALQALNATFLVKSNLTILDPIVVHGEGGSGSLGFEEAHSVLAALQFRLNESEFRPHLEHHRARGTDTLQPPALLFERSFRAVNRGNLPLEVQKIQVNGRGCSGFGFEVLTCSSLTIPSNESSHIAISFHPDLTASQVHRELVITTSVGVHRVPLVAVLPHHLLPELLQMVGAEHSSSGMRQLCLVAAAVALVLITHLSLSDLMSSVYTPKPPAQPATQEPTSLASEPEGSAPEAAAPQPSTALKGPKADKKPPKEDPVGSGAPKPSKTKKDNKEKAERDRVRELERAERARAQSELEAKRAKEAKEAKAKAKEAREKEAREAKEAKEKEARERLAQEAAQKLEAAQLKGAKEADWQVKEKRKKDKHVEATPLPQPKPPTPRNSVELDRRTSGPPNNGTAAAARQQQPQQPKKLGPLPAQTINKPAVGAPGDIWGMREKAAESLLADSNMSPRGDGFSSAIGGQRIDRAQGHAPAAVRSSGVFSSAIGGEPLGGDAIWQRPTPSISTAAPFSISPSAAPSAPLLDPTSLSLPTREQPFPAAIGKQPGAAFFNFPAAPPDTHTSSLFSGNPFFDPSLDGTDSPGLSSAIGGDLLEDDEDNANAETFGPASLSPHSSPSHQGSFGAPGGVPFSSFSDLNNHSAPFVPAGAQQQQKQRTQSRFGFPAGPAANGEEGGSNFSLFG